MQTEQGMHTELCQQRAMLAALMQCGDAVTVQCMDGRHDKKNAEQGGLRHEMKNYHGVLLPDVLLG